MELLFITRKKNLCGEIFVKSIINGVLGGRRKKTEKMKRGFSNVEEEEKSHDASYDERLLPPTPPPRLLPPTLLPPSTPPTLLPPTPPSLLPPALLPPTPPSGDESDDESDDDIDVFVKPRGTQLCIEDEEYEEEFEEWTPCPAKGSGCMGFKWGWHATCAAPACQATLHSNLCSNPIGNPSCQGNRRADCPTCKSCSGYQDFLEKPIPTLEEMKREGQLQGKLNQQQEAETTTSNKRKRCTFEYANAALCTNYLSRVNKKYRPRLLLVLMIEGRQEDPTATIECTLV